MLDKDKTFVNPQIEDISIIDDEHTTSIPVTTVELEIEPKEQSIVEVKAQRFVEALGRKQKPSEAAKSVGMSLVKIRNSEAMQEAIKALKDTFTIPPEMRRTMVRNGLNKLFLENIESEDPKRQRIALDTAKQIAADPEISLGSPESVSITFGSNLESVIESIDLPLKDA